MHMFCSDADTYVRHIAVYLVIPIVFFIVTRQEIVHSQVNVEIGALRVIVTKKKNDLIKKQSQEKIG